MKNTCEGCEDCEFEGIRWPSDTGGYGNPEHEWVERCDACERYDGDWEAQAALIKKLKKENITILSSGVADAHGAEQPYVDVEKQPA